MVGPTRRIRQVPNSARIAAVLTQQQRHHQGIEDVGDATGEDPRFAARSALLIRRSSGSQLVSARRRSAPLAMSLFFRWSMSWVARSAGAPAHSLQDAALRHAAEIVLEGGAPTITSLGE